jgi:hypothetical protein
LRLAHLILLFQLGGKFLDLLINFDELSLHLWVLGKGRRRVELFDSLLNLHFFILQGLNFRVDWGWVGFISSGGKSSEISVVDHGEDKLLDEANQDGDNFHHVNYNYKLNIYESNLFLQLLTGVVGVVGERRLVRQVNPLLWFALTLLYKLIGKQPSVLFDAVFEGEVKDDASDSEGHEEPKNDHLNWVRCATLLLWNRNPHVTQLNGLVYQIQLLRVFLIRKFWRVDVDYSFCAYKVNVKVANYLTDLGYLHKEKLTSMDASIESPF